MFQSRGPWLAKRFYCPPGSSLPMASSAPLGPAPRFMSYMPGVSPDGLLWAGSERVPHLLCWSVPFVPSSVPRQTERLHPAVASPLTLAFALFAQARHLRRHHRRLSGGQRHEAAKFTLWYGPKRLLALHRQGRLRSSFHLPSHLQEMSSITTRAISQFPRPDFHRQDQQPYGLQAKAQRKTKELD